MSMSSIASQSSRTSATTSSNAAASPIDIITVLDVSGVPEHLQSLWSTADQQHDAVAVPQTPACPSQFETFFVEVPSWMAPLRVPAAAGAGGTPSSTIVERRCDLLRQLGAAEHHSGGTAAGWRNVLFTTSIIQHKGTSQIPFVHRTPFFKGCRRLWNVAPGSDISTAGVMACEKGSMRELLRLHGVEEIRAYPAVRLTATSGTARTRDFAVLHVILAAAPDLSPSSLPPALSPLPSPPPSLLAYCLRAALHFLKATEAPLRLWVDIPSPVLCAQWLDGLAALVAVKWVGVARVSVATFNAAGDAVVEYFALKTDPTLVKDDASGGNGVNAPATVAQKVTSRKRERASLAALPTTSSGDGANTPASGAETLAQTIEKPTKKKYKKEAPPIPVTAPAGPLPLRVPTSESQGLLDWALEREEEWRGSEEVKPSNLKQHHSLSNAGSPSPPSPMDLVTRLFSDDRPLFELADLQGDVLDQRNDGRGAEGHDAVSGPSSPSSPTLAAVVAAGYVNRREMPAKDAALLGFPFFVPLASLQSADPRRYHRWVSPLLPPFFTSNLRVEQAPLSVATPPASRRSVLFIVHSELTGLQAVRELLTLWSLPPARLECHPEGAEGETVEGESEARCTAAPRVPSTSRVIVWLQPDSRAVPDLLLKWSEHPYHEHHYILPIIGVGIDGEGSSSSGAQDPLKRGVSHLCKHLSWDPSQSFAVVLSGPSPSFYSQVTSVLTTPASTPLVPADRVFRDLASCTKAINDFNAEGEEKLVPLPVGWRRFLLPQHGKTNPSSPAVAAADSAAVQQRLAAAFPDHCHMWRWVGGVGAECRVMSAAAVAAARSHHLHSLASWFTPARALLQQRKRGWRPGVVMVSGDRVCRQSKSLSWSIGLVVPPTSREELFIPATSMTEMGSREYLSQQRERRHVPPLYSTTSSSGSQDMKAWEFFHHSLRSTALSLPVVPLTDFWPLLRGVGLEFFSPALFFPAADAVAKVNWMTMVAAAPKRVGAAAAATAGVTPAVVHQHYTCYRCDTTDFLQFRVSCHITQFIQVELSIDLSVLLPLIVARDDAVEVPTGSSSTSRKRKREGGGEEQLSAVSDAVVQRHHCTCSPRAHERVIRGKDGMKRCRHMAQLWVLFILQELAGRCRQ